jgi:hypothetical protein
MNLSKEERRNKRASKKHMINIYFAFFLSQLFF